RPRWPLWQCPNRPPRSRIRSPKSSSTATIHARARRTTRFTSATAAPKPNAIASRRTCGRAARCRRCSPGRCARRTWRPSAQPVPAERRRDFFGHPRGLAYLAFTEAWERFSYYGMSALVVLYMVNQLLLPGHVEHVAGFAGFRGWIEGLFGPLSTQALASQIFGLYSGFVYFTPVLGGWLGDRIGQRSAVVLGGLSMAGGHLSMAFDQSFLLALLLLIIGSGLLKGNISAQVV